MDPTREVLVVAGLKGPVEIVVDRWGVPHIRAGNSEDLFFAQGFNVARDRLWQIDLWRKRGLGLLATDFGPGYLAQDYASRLFLYKGDMAAEWAAYGPDARMICSRFVAGINAYIALTEQDAIVFPQTAQTLPGVDAQVFRGIGHLQLCTDARVFAWVAAQLPSAEQP